MEMTEKVKAVSKECWDIYLICYFHVVLFSFVFFLAYPSPDSIGNLASYNSK